MSEASDYLLDADEKEECVGEISLCWLIFFFFFLSQSISQTKESAEKTHFQGSCPFVHTGDFGGELTIRCSFGSGSGLCGVSESDGSVRGEFSSLCLLSSNNRRRSSCVHKCIIENQKTQITLL